MGVTLSFVARRTRTRIEVSLNVLAPPGLRAGAIQSGWHALHGSMWIAGERLETNAFAPLRRP
jgi:hypothetical protein